MKTIDRHRNIIDFALSSLLRRKGKNLSLLAVYLLVVFLVASLIFFVSALKREARLIVGNAPDIVVQRMVAGRHDPVPLSCQPKIAALRGVTSVTPRLWGYYYEAVTGANYTLMVQNDPPLAAGSAILGSGVARSRRIGPGEMVNFQGYDRQTRLFSVEKVLPFDSELAAADLVLVAEEDFRDLFGFPRGFATDFAVAVANPQEISTVARKIVELYPDSRPILKSEIMRTYDSVFDWRSGMMVVMLSVVMAAFAIVVWDKASGLNAEERREIGILKSIGWETGDVLLLKFWEGAIVSLTAFLLGALAAYAHVFFFSAPLIRQALQGWSVLYPEFRLEPTIDPYQMAVLFFLCVVPYTAATILPSWRAATIDPDTAMRS